MLKGVNRTMHRVLGMTPDEAWGLEKMTGTKSWRNKRDIEEREMMSGMRLIIEEQSAIGDLLWIYQQDKLQQTTLHELHPRWEHPAY